MDDLGVMDTPEVETGAEEIESGAEAIENHEPAEGAEPAAAVGKPEGEDAYTTKFSREMRAALKSWEAANPESAKFAKQARDNHARMFALSQLEPRGVDGVREKYALLDGLVRGEAKGPEALHAIQEELAAVEEVDNLLASGDPRAFEALGEDFNQGLAKLAPAYLERIQKSDPAAFESALLPHFVQKLAQSDLVQNFNALVDVLNAQGDPRFDDKTKMQFTIQSLQKMGQWLNGLQTKAGEIKAAPQSDQRSSLDQERSQLDQERQTIHWDTRIKPSVTAHENAKFEELFSPYQKRLRLDAGAKSDLMQAFKSGMNRAGSSDADYQRQMKLYRSQKNPDPSTVSNFVKSAINRHSQTVMQSLVKARYGSFLNGWKPVVAKPAVPINGAKPKGPVAPNVEVRTVKPPMSEIDHRRTPVEWLAMKQYRLTNGKVIQVRNAK